MASVRSRYVLILHAFTSPKRNFYGTEPIVYRFNVLCLAQWRPRRFKIGTSENGLQKGMYILPDLPEDGIRTYNFHGPKTGATGFLFWGNKLVKMNI